MLVWMFLLIWINDFIRFFIKFTLWLQRVRNLSILLILQLHWLLFPVYVRKTPANQLIVVRTITCSFLFRFRSGLLQTSLYLWHGIEVFVCMLQLKWQSVFKGA